MYILPGGGGRYPPGETHICKRYLAQKGVNPRVRRASPPVYVYRIMGNHPSLTFRRATNLKDMLVHSHFKNRKKQTTRLQSVGFFKCANCKVCTIAKNIKEITMAYKKKWIIKQRITCRSQFVIYIIECPCSLRYVGSTTCELKKRILEHVRATVNTDRTNAIAKHMEKLHEGNWKSLTFFAVEQVEQQSWGGDRENIL